MGLFSKKQGAAQAATRQTVVELEQAQAAAVQKARRDAGGVFTEWERLVWQRYQREIEALKGGDHEEVVA